MTQHPIEVILAKRLASHLAMPIFLVDPMGNLLFYNELAERLLGQRFDETGEVPLEQWSTASEPMDDAGRPLPPVSFHSSPWTSASQHTEGSASVASTACGATSR